MSEERPMYDPSPVRRVFLLAEAEKVRDKCKACGQHRPLSPDDKCCGPCHYGNERLASQPDLKHGELCDDCAFRPGSPERKPSEKYLQYDCGTELEFVQQQALNQVFYCHKPFLDPRQEWGFDPEKQELIPLYGEHWRACGGWVKKFGKEIKKSGYSTEAET